MPNCLTLKKSNCKNCYKCIRHCPVKSIRFSGNQAHIIGNECILCGHCFVVCPQNAKEIVDETEKAKVLIQSGDPVVVSLAPSFVANYEGVGIEAMREALKKLGFYDVEETALGATLVKREYDRILKEEDRDVVISSCCHSINLLIQKYFPRVLPYLADVLSPMQAHCGDIKRRIPDAKTVFIGPCVAKKDEAQRYGDLVDAVLTFEELTLWMEQAGVVPQACEEDTDTGLARLFPTSGGILRTLTERVPGYMYLVVDGMENVIAALQDIEQGKVHRCFIEMSACPGSCVNGPVMVRRKSVITGSLAVNVYAGGADFPLEQPEAELLRKNFPDLTRKPNLPSPMELQRILKEMGKTKPEDELNCGTCGYDTCREKAIAIYQGKAEVSMCLPFLKEQAEHFSDSMMRNTPVAMLVLNEELEVQQLNNAAQKLLNIRYPGDVLGDQVIRIMDSSPFLQVLTTGRDIRDRRVYLADYDRYVEQTIFRDRESRSLLCILRDVTEQEEARLKREDLHRQTAETADRVVEKQMRIVQQIASLLGETAAETKIALTKLKESVNDE